MTNSGLGGRKTARFFSEWRWPIAIHVIAWPIVGVVAKQAYGMTCVVKVEKNPYAYLGRHFEFVPAAMEIWILGIFLTITARLITDRRFWGIIRYEWYLSGKKFLKVVPSEQEKRIWQGFERRKQKESA